MGVLIPGAFGGMGYHQRYILAFTAYAVAQTCEHTPAYRQPCIEALDALIEKMLERQIWEDWLLQEWGGPNPLYPYNIMYTGHPLLMMALHERLAHDGKYLDEVKLVFDPQAKFTTNLRSLAGDISTLIAENRDAAGNPYYVIACETDRVFVPCHSIPHYALNLLASMGKDVSTESTTPWLNWVKTNAYDAKTAYLCDMFVPSEATMADHPSGTWTAWSLAYIDALDSEVAAGFPPVRRGGLRRAGSPRPECSLKAMFHVAHPGPQLIMAPYPPGQGAAATIRSFDTKDKPGGQWPGWR